MGCVVWKLYYQHSNLISYLDETKARMNGRKIERISFDVGDDSEKTAEMTKQDHVMQPYFHSLIPPLLCIQVFGIAGLKLTVGDDKPTLYF